MVVFAFNSFCNFALAFHKVTTATKKHITIEIKTRKTATNSMDSAKISLPLLSFEEPEKKKESNNVIYRYYASTVYTCS